MRKQSSPMLRLVSLLIVGAVITIGISSFVMTMGAVDDGVDMSGSAYEDEYNSVTDISIISIILMKFLPIIIGVCALLIAVVGIKKYIGI
jgi:multisubunit Na+/H+ antiporter MnhG subunit